MLALVKKKNTILKGMWISFFDRRLLERSEFIHETSLNETQSIREFGLKLRGICQGCGVRHFVVEGLGIF